MHEDGHAMTMTNTTNINVSADDVWEMIGPGFLDVAKWMATFPRSEAIKGAEFVFDQEI
jgi:hypothetical protein